MYKSFLGFWAPGPLRPRGPMDPNLVNALISRVFELALPSVPLYWWAFQCGVSLLTFCESVCMSTLAQPKPVIAKA